MIDTPIPPKFEVDIFAATILTGNEAARRLFAIGEDTEFPVAIDAAMPMLSQLATCAAAPTHRPVRADVSIWTRSGVVRLEADVTRCANGRYAVAVARSAVAGDHGQPPAEEFETSITPPAPADDAGTLKAIARAIREGRSGNGRTANLKPSAGERPATLEQTDGPRADPNKTAGSPRHLSKLAHELKTPLSAIAAAAEIMRDERLGEMGNAKYLGYASDIHDSARHALAVINQMLSGNATDTAAIPTEELVDLNDLAGRIVSSMRPLADDRRIALIFEAVDGEPRILADATSIRQILLNLLTNAIKFTGRGGDVRVVTGYLPDGSVFLVVRDTGSGMDRSELAMAVSDDRGDGRSSPRRGGGLGIGLPLVRRLVAANHAKIEIDSAPGKGTAVLVAFPRDRVDVS